MHKHGPMQNMKLDLILCGPRDLVRRLQALFERVALPVWAAVQSKATIPPPKKKIFFSHPFARVGKASPVFVG